MCDIVTHLVDLVLFVPALECFVAFDLGFGPGACIALCPATALPRAFRSTFWTTSDIVSTTSKKGRDRRTGGVFGAQQ